MLMYALVFVAFCAALYGLYVWTFISGHTWVRVCGSCNPPVPTQTTFVEGRPPHERCPKCGNSFTYYYEWVPKGYVR